MTFERIGTGIEGYYRKACRGLVALAVCAPLAFAACGTEGSVEESTENLTAAASGVAIRAKLIAVGGPTCAVGTDNIVYKYNSSRSWSAYTLNGLPSLTGAKKIAVADSTSRFPNAVYVLVGSTIYFHTGDNLTANWVSIDGVTKDIACGKNPFASENLWRIGATNNIETCPNGSAWRQFSPQPKVGTLVELAVAKDGKPSVRNSNGDAFYWNGTTWRAAGISGSTDISANGAQSSLWIVQYPALYTNRYSSGFQRFDTYAGTDDIGPSKVAAGADGNPWAISTNPNLGVGNVYQWVNRWYPQ